MHIEDKKSASFFHFSIFSSVFLAHLFSDFLHSGGNKLKGEAFLLRFEEQQVHFPHC